MELTAVAIKVPESMHDFITENQCRDELVRNALILYPYIKDLTISHGRAAEILGIPKERLIALYGDMGIPYIDGDANMLNEELATYDAVRRKG